MTLVYWDDDFGLAVEPAVRTESTLRALEVLRGVTTLGQVRRLYPTLPDWARRVVDNYLEIHEDNGEPLDDDEEWPASDIGLLVAYAVPLPWDADSLREWLDADLIATHLRIGGASPGGNIDTYVADDTTTFLEALEGNGYEVEHMPDLVQRYFDLL